MGRGSFLWSCEGCVASRFLGFWCFFEKHGGGCMITFGWGLEQGFCFGTSKLLACLQPNDDDFGFFFGLRTYPMLTTYLLLFCFSVPGSYLSTY